MDDIQTLCVFCSSSNKTPDRYKRVVPEITQLCSALNLHLVYGGGSGGLMGVLADEAIRQNVPVTGVITEHLKDLEVAHEDLTELHLVPDMHERQMKMADLSDAFLILPGGVGTLAELFEVITWKQLGLHKKPIILFNLDDYWDDLIKMLDKASEDGLLHGDYLDVIDIVKTVDQLEEKLKIT